MMTSGKAVETELHFPAGRRLTSTGPAKFRPRYMLLTFAIILSSLYYWPRRAQFFIPPAIQHELKQTAANDIFDWETLEPSTSLQYSSCYEKYQCARLILPMDYWNGTTDATVTLALIRKPAAVPVTHIRYGGAVILQPGGPGAHGVQFGIRVGEQLGSLLQAPKDDDEGKYFDLISFDPRGIGLSTPRIACFHGNPVLEQVWGIRDWELGSFSTSDIAFGRLWAMSRAKGESCAIASEEPDIKRYVTTAYVARDILEIIEKHGEWREKEAKRLLADDYHGTREVDILSQISYRPGQEKLLYWGFSYGTYVGSTFAAMYPDRVGRLVLDGVVDVMDNLQITWYTDLADTEKTMDSFYHYCAEAGYPACALANPDGNTNATHVKQRTLAVIEKLRFDPVVVIGPNPEVITSNDLRMLIFSSLYKPVKMYPALASTLAELEKGNGSSAAQMLRPYHSMECRASSSVEQVFDLDAQTVITCTDGDDQTNMSRTDFESFTKQLMEISPTIGDIWAAVRMHCIHYPMRAQYRYAGPWETSPAQPILFIGNTADPVTPLINAYKMADRFKDSVVLVQDSPGHASLAAYSKCTTQYVRQYFTTGKLPQHNTTCQSDEKPFEFGENAQRTAAHTQHMEISEAFTKYGLGLRAQVGHIS